MKQNANSRRLAQIARSALASILMFELADPRLEMVSISACEVSVDRAICHVYVVSSADSYDAVLEGLTSAKGRIRTLLGKRLGWRVTPELFFHIDRSADEAERIMKALQQVPENIHIEKDEYGYPVDKQDENLRHERSCSEHSI